MAKKPKEDAVADKNVTAEPPGLEEVKVDEVVPMTHEKVMAPVEKPNAPVGALFVWDGNDMAPVAGNDGTLYTMDGLNALESTVVDQSKVHASLRTRLEEAEKRAANAETLCTQLMEDLRKKTANDDVDSMGLKKVV